MKIIDVRQLVNEALSPAGYLPIRKQAGKSF